MKTIKIKISTLILGVLLFCTASPLKAQNADFVAFTNESNNTSIAGADVKHTLLGKKTRWENKSKVILALIKPNTELGKKIAENVFKLSSAQLNKHYLTLVFQGKISAPKFFTNQEELIQFVKSTPGAIGVAEQTALDGVKILNLN